MRRVFSSLSQTKTTNPTHKEAQMNNYNNEIDKSKIIFLGIDVHNLTWHVTIRTHEQELFSRGYPVTGKV